MYLNHCPLWKVTLAVWLVINKAVLCGACVERQETTFGMHNPAYVQKWTNRSGRKLRCYSWRERQRQ